MWRQRYNLQQLITRRWLDGEHSSGAISTQGGRHEVLAAHYSPRRRAWCFQLRPRRKPWRATTIAGIGQGAPRGRMFSSVAPTDLTVAAPPTIMN
jgi:hypothetical protein